MDNFEKTHLDDSQRLELSRAIYLVTAEESIPGSLFMSKYQLLPAGIHLQTSAVWEGEIRCCLGIYRSHRKYNYNVINIADGWQSVIRPTWVGLGEH